MKTELHYGHFVNSSIFSHDFLGTVSFLSTNLLQLEAELFTFSNYYFQ